MRQWGLLLSLRIGEGIGNMRRDIPIDVEEAARLYESGHTLMELGDHFGCSWMTIRRRLKASGVEMRSVGCRSGKSAHDSRVCDARIIELHGRGLSDYEIADRLEISRYVVNNQIRKAIGYRGKGKSFSRELVCPRCGKRFKTMIKNQEYCSDTCRNAAHLQRRDDEKRANTVSTIEEITLREIWGRDKGRCYICGRKTDWGDYYIKDGWRVTGPRYPTREHVVALSNGGTHTRDNIRLACFECNTKKGNKGQMRMAIA